MQGFLRINDVLRVIPISRSGWWQGVAEGRFPPGVKLTARTTAWRQADIALLCELLADGKDWRDRPQEVGHAAA